MFNKLHYGINLFFRNQMAAQASPTLEKMSTDLADHQFSEEEPPSSLQIFHMVKLQNEKMAAQEAQMSELLQTLQKFMISNTTAPAPTAKMDDGKPMSDLADNEEPPVQFQPPKTKTVPLGTIRPTSPTTPPKSRAAVSPDRRSSLPETELPEHGLTDEELRDIFGILQGLEHRTISDPKHRTSQRTKLMERMSTRQFRLVEDSLKFRSFLQDFVYEFNTAELDSADSAAVFMAAMDENAKIYLKTTETPVRDFNLLVKAIAVRSQPHLPELIKLQDQFGLEIPGRRSLEAYYNALMEYHRNTPQAFTKLTVLTHFLKTIPVNQNQAIHNQLVHCKGVPSQAALLRIIKSVHTTAGPAPPLPPTPQNAMAGQTHQKRAPSTGSSSFGSSNGPNKRPTGPYPGPICKQCRGPHNISRCIQKCINCWALGHSAMDCKKLCDHCQKPGGHVYKYCEENTREQQQQLNMLQVPSPKVAPAPPVSVPPTKNRFTMSMFIVAANNVEEQLATFKVANDGSGQVLHRQWQIGSQEATVAIDTGCAKSIIAQRFLEQFDIPADYYKKVDVKVDNGTTVTTITQSIVLPVHFGHYHIATEFLVVPKLAQPLDALLSWSWGRTLNVVLDFANNDLSMTEEPPQFCQVPATFHQLKPKSVTSAEPTSTGSDIQPID
ncbi:MAG: hypothetical protein WB421_13530 [Terriglobales bacterium]